MSKILRKRIVIRSDRLQGVASKADETTETIGGTPLNAKRKRQGLSEALRETIDHNRAALLKLARH